jgi:hypothetical protein
MIEAYTAAFNKYNVRNLVKSIEGPPDQPIDKLEGASNLVFVNANKDGYEGYVNMSSRSWRRSCCCQRTASFCMTK